MKQGIFIFALTVSIFISGYITGQGLTEVGISKTFECHSIAGFHADLLMRRYSINFNFDQDDPNRHLNQKALELNTRLLELCNIDPTK